MLLFLGVTLTLYFDLKFFFLASSAFVFFNSVILNQLLGFHFPLSPGSPQLPHSQWPQRKVQKILLLIAL
jgi:hypothetical protein